MADSDLSASIDLTKVSADDLREIQNEVLRQLIARRLASPGGLNAGHDSHGSVHGKNSIFADLAEVVSRPETKQQ